MVKTIADALMEQGGLQTSQRLLRALLEERFKPLPEGLLAQINTQTDLQRLEAAVLQAARLEKLDDLHL